MTKGKKLLVFGIVLVVIDQIIKVLVKTNMSLGESFNVIGDWFRILFVENEGMAFGMSFGGMIGKFILSTFRIVLSGVLVWWIAKLSKDEEKKVPTGFLIGMTAITAGAIGNIIDCLFYGMLFSASDYAVVAEFGGHYAAPLFGKVVDMFYFPIINTTWPAWLPVIGGQPFTFFDPIFNFADSCVTCGAFYLILFQWKYISKEFGDSKEKSLEE